VQLATRPTMLAESMDPGSILLQRARELGPSLRARAAQTESERRISDETIADFRRTGISRALQPPRYGGIATDFGVAARICDYLARACPASSWVYANFILLQWHLGLFAAQAQDEVWGADPDALVAAAYMSVGTAKMVDGGYSLSGSWRYASGIDNANWCLLGGRVVDVGSGAPIKQGFFLLSPDQYQIEDNWYVVGLSGTGSKDVTVNEAFVPEWRWLELDACNSGAAPGIAVNDHPLFRAPLYAIFSYFLSGIAIGGAQGAIDDFVEATTLRKTIGGAAGRQVPVAQFPNIQIALTEAEAKVDAARTLIHRDCDNVVATLKSGKALSVDQRIANRRSVGYGVRLAREAVDSLFAVTGAAGLFNDSVIQRHWRDVNAVAHHFSLEWNQIGSLVGAYRLGIDPVGMF
jgi:resorcinol 4-hydroxylase (FADH2)